MENLTDEQLLTAVAEAQTAYWDATAALERSLGFEVDADDYSAVTIESLKANYGKPKATVEQRWDKDGDECWCVLFDGKVYPFGEGDIGKECAELSAEQIATGESAYSESDYYFYTVNPRPIPVEPHQIEVFENEGGRHA